MIYRILLALVVSSIGLASCSAEADSESSATTDPVDSTAPESTTSTSVADDPPPSSSVVATTGTTTSSASTTTTSTTTAADPAGDGFRSPTGNIHCVVDDDGARCSHRGDTPWKVGGTLPTWAVGLSFGFEESGCVEGGFIGFGIEATGRPAALCGDALFEVEDLTLDYGDALTRGSVTCQSQRFGVTCLNGDGNGFRLATNEIAMLYGRSQDWVASEPATADDRLGHAQQTTIEGGTKISTSGGRVACYLSDFSAIDGHVSAECAADGNASPGDDWSPDQRSCQGADFSGYYISAGPQALGTATFGCATDVGPLYDPGFPSTAIADGEAVVLGEIRCVNTDDSLACHDGDGNGVLVNPLEVSFFYRRSP